MHFSHLIAKDQRDVIKHRPIASNLLDFINFVAKRRNSRKEVFNRKNLVLKIYTMPLSVQIKLTLVDYYIFEIYQKGHP